MNMIKYAKASRALKYKGFSAAVMEAERLRGDYVHQLPPGRALPVFHADQFLTYPENWMKGPGVFVIPVNPDKGLWFDWRTNSEVNTAVLPTVKGSNPITGLATSGFHLERYDNKCPKHGCDFLADRFCKECNYKWPDRNYVSMHPLWWDGFRADDGTVRQFFFTQDELKDIATGLIGKENTVPALGFAFYTPKSPRPEASVRSNVIQISASHSSQCYGGSIKMFNTGGGAIQSFYTNTSSVAPDALYENNSAKYMTKSAPSSSKLSAATRHKKVGGSVRSISAGGPIGAGGQSASSGEIQMQALHLGVDSDHEASFNMADIASENQEYSLNFMAADAMPVAAAASPAEYLDTGMEKASDYDSGTKQATQDFRPDKEVSVGAGAKIAQALPNDSYPVDSWKETPDAAMTVYFVFEETLDKMMAGGMRDLEGVPEGMLQGLPVG